MFPISSVIKGSLEKELLKLGMDNDISDFRREPRL